MPKLPVVSGKEVVKALTKTGYEVDHQKGNHVTLRRIEYPHRRVTVPMHKEIAKGTLKAILTEAGLSVDEFIELL
jgi:predicted RNA binding protein YcfA (HicA-like mRNA interferase family)